MPPSEAAAPPGINLEAVCDASWQSPLDLPAGGRPSGTPAGPLLHATSLYMKTPNDGDEKASSFENPYQSNTMTDLTNPAGFSRDAANASLMASSGNVWAMGGALWVAPALS